MKRLFDIVLALISLLIFSPIFILLYVLIYTKLGSPVIFSQIRPGKNGTKFVMYKFRTMLDIKDENGELISDDQRLTNFGKLLRSTSLDELPELFNVLKGDMSIVGPRPLLVEYLNYYTPEQARRHEVRPGITGWAQVNGRNSISWEDKFKLDIWYIDNRSMALDIKIILLTVVSVIGRRGISEKGLPTASKFIGTNDE